MRSAVVALLFTMVTAVASAQPATPPAGAASLSLARDAYDHARFDVASAKYQAALDAGGLAPTDVVDAYVHLGVALTAVRKYTPALAAFREAALLDPRFEVPRGAAPLAKAMAERARKEKAKFGGIALAADVPSLVRTGKAIPVSATLDAAHLTLPAKVSIAVKDSLSGAHFESDAAPAPEMAFEIPARMTLPGASLAVRIDALDAHANRLATVEQRVRIEGAAAVAANDTPRDEGHGETPRPEKKEAPKTSGGGFWSSPWPYVIGGVALAAGGAAAYFVTRPSDDVVVNGAHVQVR